MRSFWRTLLVMSVLFSMLVATGPPVGAAAERPIRGKITRLGEPVVGVGVAIADLAAGTARVTCTDAEGRYRFNKVTVGAELTLATGRFLVEPDSVEGTAPCTNWDFAATSGKPWLNYRHPDSHGVWRPQDPVSFILPGGTGAYRVNIRLRSAARVCVTYKATLWGTSGPDVLEGTRGHDVIIGRAGKDIITGKGGSDLICGDGANDTLRGGGGGDFLFGGAGNRDRMLGGPGADLCFDVVFKKADCESVLP